MTGSNNKNNNIIIIYYNIIQNSLVLYYTEQNLMYLSTIVQLFGAHGTIGTFTFLSPHNGFQTVN